MNKLSIVFVFKIALTLIFWSLLPLLFPPSWLEFFGLPQQSSYVFIKLYGMATFALVIGYGFGLRESYPSRNKQARRLMSAIWVGIVSNAGACLILLLYGLSGAWNAWGIVLQWGLWGSMAVTGMIALSLIIFGVLDKTLPVVE